MARKPNRNEPKGKRPVKKSITPDSMLKMSFAELNEIAVNPENSLGLRFHAQTVLRSRKFKQ